MYTWCTPLLLPLASVGSVKKHSSLPSILWQGYELLLRMARVCHAPVLLCTVTITQADLTDTNIAHYHDRMVVYKYWTLNTAFSVKQKAWSSLQLRGCRIVKNDTVVSQSWASTHISWLLAPAATSSKTFAWVQFAAGASVVQQHRTNTGKINTISREVIMIGVHYWSLRCQTMATSAARANQFWWMAVSTCRRKEV